MPSERFRRYCAFADGLSNSAGFPEDAEAIRSQNVENISSLGDSATSDLYRLRTA
jgi:hypothetical protein